MIDTGCFVKVLRKTVFFNGVNFAFRTCTILHLLAFINCQEPIKIERDNKYPYEKFKVYWNVPTFVCKKYGVNFADLHKKYDIIANKNDSFRGESINILYDPGLFPSVLKDKSGKISERNGGIPQLGNITVHLEDFRRIVEEVVSPNLKGLGVIDFEAWRPIFRQNWRSQAIYKNMSIDLERQFHPQRNEKELKKMAKNDFEKAAKVFMEKTLELAKLLRPNALWGYYGFPYCYNFRAKRTPYCTDLAVRDNDHIHWLFDKSDALYPSIYMSSELSDSEQVEFIIGRLNEAWRTATIGERKTNAKVYPYAWYRYYDKELYLSEENMYASLEITRQYQMGGIVIWGASSDVKSEKKCKTLANYVDTILGPIILKVRRNENKIVQPSPSSVYWTIFWQKLKPLENYDVQIYEGQNNGTVEIRGELYLK